jgi:hypothetical protein
MNDKLSMELKPVLDLASEYLTHVLIAGLSLYNDEIDLPLNCSTVRNPGGKKTPQVSVCSTGYSPDLGSHQGID